MGETAPNIYERVHKKLSTEKVAFEEELKKCEIDLSNSDKRIEKCIKLALQLPSAWISADYSGKQQLQKIMFPEGIRYDKEKGEYLTPRVNEIFVLIHCLSTELEEKKNGTFNFLIEKSRLVPRAGVEPACQ